MGIDAVERGKHGGHRLGALHDGIEQTSVELQAVGVAQQLVHEVAIACRPLGRNDGDALGHLGERQLLVHVDDALGLEAIEDFLALALHVAHRVAGVDVVDHHLHAIQAMIGYRHIHQHLHARREHLSRSFEELIVEFGVIAGPNGSAHLGNGLTSSIFLNQFGVTVSTAVQTQVAGLGNHPLVKQLGVTVQCSLDAAVELAQGDTVRLIEKIGLIHLTRLILLPL